MGLALLTGCQSNYYAQKYRNELAPGDESTLLPHTGEAEIVQVGVTELAAETTKAERRGYALIGYSKFTADTDNYMGKLSEEAKAVQADLVLSCITEAGYQNQVVAMDKASAMSTNMSSTGGYQVSVGGRTPASSMGGPSGQVNVTAPMMMDSVPQTIYRAVFLRKCAAPPAPRPVAP
jgi:hypothetical protein